ncbi:MAG: hypothetical protein A2075_09105 [Geobacteraceae bacterium GWC2_58_44]|nr:MAG: hypothetical protein A2075_09105 [Geobacteraceae bacterium GWC2_58_44]HBG07671.1 hypothetical protein [Geobacter sp.]
MFDFADDSSIFLADSLHRAIVGANDPVQVLYDAPFQLEQIYEGRVETSSPACSMLDSDVASLSVKHGTSLTVMKISSLVGNFEVIGVEPDGVGMTRLILTKDP